MAFQTVSLSTDAYEKLKAQKREGESFSDVVMRVQFAPPSTESSGVRFAGILTGEEADEWLKGVERVRKSVKVRKW